MRDCRVGGTACAWNTWDAHNRTCEWAVQPCDTPHSTHVVGTWRHAVTSCQSITDALTCDYNYKVTRRWGDSMGGQRICGCGSAETGGAWTVQMSAADIAAGH